MATESEIIGEIEEKAKHCRTWTIGITRDPVHRREEHGNPKIWYQWNAVLEPSAQNIERYFLDKGMKGTSGGGAYATYVYIFM